MQKREKNLSFILLGMLIFYIFSMGNVYGSEFDIKLEDVTDKGEMIVEYEDGKEKIEVSSGNLEKIIEEALKEGIKSEDGNYIYKELDDKNISLLKYIGDTDGDIIIRDKIDGYNVKKVGDGSSIFLDNISIMGSLIIYGDDVEISDYAFSNIDIDKGVIFLTGKGGIDYPEGMQPKMGEWVFDNTNFKFLDIPNGFNPSQNTFRGIRGNIFKGEDISDDIVIYMKNKLEEKMILALNNEFVNKSKTGKSYDLGVTVMTSKGIDSLYEDALLGLEVNNIILGPEVHKLSDNSLNLKGEKSTNVYVLSNKLLNTREELERAFVKSGKDNIFTYIYNSQSENKVLFDLLTENKSFVMDLLSNEIELKNGLGSNEFITFNTKKDNILKMNISNRLFDNNIDNNLFSDENISLDSFYLDLEMNRLLDDETIYLDINMDEIKVNIRIIDYMNLDERIINIPFTSKIEDSKLIIDFKDGDNFQNIDLLKGFLSIEIPFNLDGFYEMNTYSGEYKLKSGLTIKSFKSMDLKGDTIEIGRSKEEYIESLTYREVGNGDARIISKENFFHHIDIDNDESIGLIEMDNTDSYQDLDVDYRGRKNIELGKYESLLSESYSNLDGDILSVDIYEIISSGNDGRIKNSNFLELFVLEKDENTYSNEDSFSLEKNIGDYNLLGYIKGDYKVLEEYKKLVKDKEDLFSEEIEDELYGKNYEIKEIDNFTEGDFDLINLYLEDNIYPSEHIVFLYSRTSKSMEEEKDKIDKIDDMIELDKSLMDEIYLDNVGKVQIMPEKKLMLSSNNKHMKFVEGYEDGTIRAEENISRDETAAIFSRIIDDRVLKDLDSRDYEFPNISKDNWAYKYFNNLVNLGIIEAEKLNDLDLKQEITRGEVALLMGKYGNLTKKDYSNFEDVRGNIGEAYIDSVVEIGWMYEFGNGDFRPNDFIARGELVALINNMLNRKVDIDYIRGEVKEFKDLSIDDWYYSPIAEAANSHICEDERLENLGEKWIEILLEY